MREFPCSTWCCCENDSLCEMACRYPVAHVAVVQGILYNFFSLIRQMLSFNAILINGVGRVVVVVVAATREDGDLNKDRVRIQSNMWSSVRIQRDSLKHRGNGKRITTQMDLHAQI